MKGQSRYLVDKSALARMPHESVHRRLRPIIENGEAATCAIIDLEVLYSARSAADYERIRRRRSLAYQQIPIVQPMLDRALVVQAQLAGVGKHRVSIPDLIIAAVAEQASLTVLHHDADYDRIAEVSGQPVEWVVPRGSVP